MKAMKKVATKGETLGALAAASGVDMKAMKAMKAMKKVATKGETLGALGAASGVDKKGVKAVLEALENEAVAQLKKSEKFVIPGVAMIKLRHKPAQPAGMRNIFG